MPLPATVELLAAFAALMERRGWRWYVFGAQAVLAYGRPRLTADVDVTVDAVGASATELLAELASAAFIPRGRGFEALITRSRLLPMVHEPTAIPLDIVLAGPGIDQDFLERAQRVDVGGVSVPILCVEDLLATKVLAGREKDLEDVRGILAERRDRIDLARARAVLRELDRALGRPELLESFDRLVAGGDPALPPRRGAPRRRLRLRRGR